MAGPVVVEMAYSVYRVGGLNTASCRHPGATYGDDGDLSAVSGAVVLQWCCRRGWRGEGAAGRSQSAWLAIMGCMLSAAGRPTDRAD